jgi:hypothetical protein
MYLFGEYSAWCVVIIRLVSADPLCLPCAGAAAFEASLSELIKGGADLSSRQLRQLMAPAATAGLGALAGRSLQVRGRLSMVVVLLQLASRARSRLVLRLRLEL